MDNYVRKCRFLRIIDGDSAEVEVELGYYIKICHQFRLSGIDTPELGTGDPAIAAKLHLMRYAGKVLFVKSEKPDKYGRYLGTFWEDVNLRSINQEMLDLGLAKPYSGGKREA